MFLENKRSTRINSPQLQIKNQIVIPLDLGKRSSKIRANFVSHPQINMV